MNATTSLIHFKFNGWSIPAWLPYPTNVANQQAFISTKPGKCPQCYIDPFSLELPHNPVHVQAPNKQLECSSQVFEHVTVVCSMMTIGLGKQTRR